MALYTTKREITDEEWTNVKPQIKYLYLDLDWNLNEVVEAMKEDPWRFSAT